MASKQDWLDEGCIILSEGGVLALTIDLLCQRLGLTKGSFYHHFKGFNGYKTDLLAYFEQEGTHNIIHITEQAQTPPDKLRRLLETSTSYPPNLEVAIRAWALQDADVRTVQARVDEQRVAYVQKLFIELGESTDRARLLAQLLYTVLIGSQQIQPHIDEAGMVQLFNEFQRLYGGINS
ncbi:MAG: TetR/AcrR family transcriptional regulator [bacterium]|nr:TetR/AcrR family transcriptional regulator [bacterium]